MRKSTSVKFLFMNLPFICFIALMGVLYIANTHRAEKNLLKLQQLKSDIKEAKWEYMEIQQEIMFNKTQSQLLNLLKDKDLKENRSIPEIIKAKES